MKRLTAISVLLGAAFTGGTVLAAPPPDGPKPPRPPEQFRRGPGFWRAFSQLSDQEREELQKLQRSDPEKFRKILEEKAEELYRQEMKRTAELREIVTAYRNTEDEAKRKELRERMQKLCRENFDRRLAAGRRQLEEMKKRVKRIEHELDQRAQRSDEIVNAQVDGLLSGKLELPQPGRRPPAPPQGYPPPHK